MIYFTEETIANAWVNLKDSTPNKFWGLLFILKTLDIPLNTIIQPGTYKINVTDLSQELASTFYFDDSSRHNGMSDWWITFSNDWIIKIQEIFLKRNKVDISSVAIMTFQNSGFSHEYSSSELSKKIESELHLNEEILDNWFDQSNSGYIISYSLNKPDRRRLLTLLKSKLGINSDNSEKTVTFESPYTVTSHPSEFTRGPFIQTLYSAQANLECVILTKFDFSKQYQVIKSVKTDKKNFPAYHNRIVYGAPGTGKSALLEDESHFFGNRKLRITFYPDYSYSKFVGSYKPISYYKRDINTPSYYSTKYSDEPKSSVINEPVIDYGFVPGPFLIALEEALKNPEPYLLVIEEINRANSSSVFGEIFQLLDREEGKSKYTVLLSKEAMEYLKSKISSKFDLLKDGIYLPENLFIWASMNSADQGVFPLDSAFKRRWHFEYLPLNQYEYVLDKVIIDFDGRSYHWNKFRNTINSFLSSIKVSEDKLIGPFFLSVNELQDKNAIKNKLLLYIKDDVLRHNYDKFFNANLHTFNDISKIYGQGKILRAEIIDELTNSVEIFQNTDFDKND